MKVGTAVTATLTGADGSAANWLALAEAGSPDSSFVQQIVLSAGVTDFPWTVAVGGPGTYDFRFFSAANRRLATSAPLVVEVGAPGMIVNVPTLPSGRR